MAQKCPLFEAVNLQQRAALGDDGKVYEITNLIDVYGDEVDEPTNIKSCVVKVNDDCWAVLDMSEFEQGWSM